MPLFQKLLQNKAVRENTVASVMLAPFPIVKTGDSIDSIARKINKENNAVMMMDMGGNWHIITKYDIIEALS